MPNLNLNSSISLVEFQNYLLFEYFPKENLKSNQEFSKFFVVVMSYLNDLFRVNWIDTFQSKCWNINITHFFVYNNVLNSTIFNQEFNGIIEDFACLIKFATSEFANVV